VGEATALVCCSGEVDFAFHYSQVDAEGAVRGGSAGLRSAVAVGLKAFSGAGEGRISWKESKGALEDLMKSKRLPSCRN